MYKRETVDLENSQTDSYVGVGSAVDSGDFLYCNEVSKSKELELYICIYTVYLLLVLYI